MNESLREATFKNLRLLRISRKQREKRIKKNCGGIGLLVGGFYIFKHEYIFLFKKVKK
jgi:hypothetical protein